MANFTVWERLKRDRTGAAAPADSPTLPSVLQGAGNSGPALSKREND